MNVNHLELSETWIHETATDADLDRLARAVRARRRRLREAYEHGVAVAFLNGHFALLCYDLKSLDGSERLVGEINGPHLADMVPVGGVGGRFGFAVPRGPAMMVNRIEVILRVGSSIARPVATYTRSTPRAESPVIDLSELPPGGPS